MASKQRVPPPSNPFSGVVSAFDDLASTIASPPATRPIAGAIGRAGQAYCNAIGSAPGLYGDILRNVPGVPSLLCKPYWDSRGYSAPVATNPFKGGQCAGQIYELEGTAELTNVLCANANNTSTSTSNLSDFWAPQLEGPVTDISWVASGGTCQGLPRGLVLSVTDLGGARTRTQQWLSNQNTFGRRVDRFAPVLVPIGGTDNCGDPASGFEPGANPPPITTFPPGQEPGIDPDGQPFFFVPPIPNPVPPLEPIDVPEDSPGGGGTGGPTEPPVAGDEQEGSDGDEEFPPPEEGRRWVGCCIRLTSIPVGTGTVPGTSPQTILTQVVGNARLLFDSVSGDGYDTPVQIRSSGLCLWEPVKGLSPKGIRVNLKPGFEYSYTPYSVAEED